MEKSFSRSSRISQELQKNIAVIIQHSLKDPRIKTIITVSEVRLSKDLSYAQVFISFLENNYNLTVKKTLIILNKAAGYIRKLLCNKMNLRIIPTIVFFHDDSFFKGNKISVLLNKIKKNNNIIL
ncbi:30S ribosome-binding factor RbfA [Buchnera aphidicola]|uniref:Ribosome-binding factor A n=1 Tax=Buchnera aphidicola subsp. Rhopalosiphum maidis TaxID=118109 RepID=A0A3G2I6F3_BUCRM|nr:30S ribosome-binding factor RbfA [Buchnera aphidicola]AYN24693.1 30S ribosome-binding factor RbfA [Buchnera aphidicola (Rhopalosiphum maidis)]